MAATEMVMKSHNTEMAIELRAPSIYSKPVRRGILEKKMVAQTSKVFNSEKYAAKTR